MNNQTRSRLSYRRGTGLLFCKISVLVYIIATFCVAHAQKIGEIQGNSAVSPYENEQVEFTGIVTALQADRNSQGVIYHTIYIQEIETDNDPNTSDAIPVFIGQSAPKVTIGDLVNVSGRVQEFYGLTELTDRGIQIDLLQSEHPLPEPLLISLPQGADEESLKQFLEPYEGMRITLGDEDWTAVNPTYAGCGFHLVPYQIDGLLYKRSADTFYSDVLPVIYETDVDCTGFPNLKVGDEIAGITGILTYHFDQFKLLAMEQDWQITPSSQELEIPDLPETGEDEWSIATYNLLNNFDDWSATGDLSEPVYTNDEIEAKQRKIAETITSVLNCPTIIAVQEIENESLLNGIATKLSECAYRPVHLESADQRGIDVAYLVRDTVEIEQQSLQQGCTTIETGILDTNITCPTGQWPLFSRAPFLLDVIIEGRPIRILNNHLKSKRGGENETASHRTAQAEFLAALVQKSDRPVVVVGDMNDYEQSAVSRILTGSGLQPVLQQIPDEERYSFLYNGAAQLIDGIFSSPEIGVSSVHIAHLNARYPASFDQREDVIRSSDHDIPLAIFSLDEQRITTKEADERAYGRNAIYLFGVIGVMVFGIWIGRKSK